MRARFDRLSLSCLAAITLALGTTASGEPQPALPEKSPDDIRLDVDAYWGNARVKDSGGKLHLTITPTGAHYTAQAGGKQTDDFSFPLSADEYAAAYHLVRDNQIGALPHKHEMVYDSFGNESIRVRSPVSSSGPRVVELSVDNNAIDRIEDPRWKTAFDGLKAIADAAVKRKHTSGTSAFRIERAPAIAGQTIQARFAGVFESREPVQLVPGTYKVSLRVWPKGMDKYDEARLLPWTGEVSIPADKGLLVDVVDGKVQVSRKK